MSAKPGSIIHGTLKTDDLLYAFASELQALVVADKSIEGTTERTWVESLIDKAWIHANLAPNSEQAMHLLDELSDALDEYSPPGHHFGAHVGDGSDFGFWPNGENDE